MYFPERQSENHVVKLSDGTLITEWPWIISPDFVNVIEVTEKQKIFCFRQSKYGIDGMSLAPVGRYIENGEDPKDAAVRELVEEMGCKSDKWVDMGKFYVDPNRGIATGDFFLARDAYYYCEPCSDDIEDQELLYLRY